jgi:hypothetical protein
MSVRHVYDESSFLPFKMFDDVFIRGAAIFPNTGSVIKTITYICKMLIILRHEKNMTLVRFEVFTAVTIKNVVFWDIKINFVLHRRHITSPLQSPAS